MKKKILILASQNGSNFEAIIKYFKNRTDLTFELLVNNKNAYALKRAKNLNVRAIYLEKNKIDDFIIKSDYDFIFMAGFLQILKEETVTKKKIVNLHPSLLPKYKGLEAIKKAFLNNENKTGITIHYATKNVDEGEIIFQKELKIEKNYTLEILEKKIHSLEHYYYPRIIEKLLGLNVLVIGKGAREHAIAEKISNSKFLNKLYLADSNDGFKNLGEIISYKNYSELSNLALKKNINLVIVGAENYLCDGIVNVFQKNNIKIIGSDKNFSKLEGSKLFAKKLMKKYKIKTSPYKKITKIKNINKVLSKFKNPIIKIDSLASGKGVYLGKNLKDIKKELKEFLNGKFGKKAKTALIEEKLFGEEISLFSFWDGKNLLSFPLAKDFKQNSKGENTGGLASICPVEINLKAAKNLEIYKKKILNLLKKEKISTPFVLYSGLMVSKDDIYVLEYNIRLGDPETQSLLNYIQNDWLEIFYYQAIQALDKINLKLGEKTSYCVVLTSSNYPKKENEIFEIKNLENFTSRTKTYYANIKKGNNTITTTGGRILSVVGEDLEEIYKKLNSIDFKNKTYKIIV